MKTLSEYIMDWMVNCKKNSVKISTYDRLLTTYNAFVAYPIASIPLSDLTSRNIQTYVNSLVDDGYSMSTIKKQFLLVHAFLEYAFVQGLIERPIHKLIKMPTQSVVKKKRRDVYGYSKMEQDLLIGAFKRENSLPCLAAWLMMETGMRVGETLALKWDDILWSKRAIRINKTMVRIANKKTMVLQDGAKSKSSNRIIPMSNAARQILEEIWNKSYEQGAFIFRSKSGEPITYEALRYNVRKVCEFVNVPYLGQHAFRHTFATNCYNRGCDVKILSKLLGHSDVTITYNVYIHLYGDALEEMRSVLG